MKKCALFYYMLRRLDLFLLNFVSHLKKTPLPAEHHPRAAPASLPCPHQMLSLSADSLGWTVLGFPGAGAGGPSLSALHSSLPG